MVFFWLFTAGIWLIGLYMLTVLGPAGFCIVIPVCSGFTFFLYQIVFGEKRGYEYSDDSDEDTEDRDPFRLDSSGIPKDPVTRWWLYKELGEQDQRDHQGDNH